MATESPAPIGQRHSPLLALRGRVQFSTLDTTAPLAPLVIAMFGSAAALGYVYLPSGDFPQGVGTTLLIVAILAAVFFLIMLRSLRTMQDGLAVYDDRIVLHPCRRGGSDAQLILCLGELEHLALRKSWIRLRHRNGRRYSFKGPRLSIGDVFDLLVERVHSVNPACEVQSPLGTTRE